MPKFLIRMGHDGFIRYKAVIEAETKEAAIALAEEDDCDWLEDGVSEYDDRTFFPEETEEVSAEEAAEIALEAQECADDTFSIQIDKRELATILVALRCYQSIDFMTRNLLIDEVVDSREDALSSDEVEDLCEKVNCA